MTLSKSKSELNAVNQMLQSIGQAPVTTLEQSNPDVAIAYDTLMQVSRDVQAEGWTFNKEYHYSMALNSDGTVDVPEGMLQCMLSPDKAENANKRAVLRSRDSVSPTGSVVRKLYDIISHTFIWTDKPCCDIVWFHDYVNIPVTVQSYIIARASTMFAQRTTGDQVQVSMLQQQEAQVKAYALEYETQQIRRYYHGYNDEGNWYQSYEPYQALAR
tara:strand:+ start:1451 stop:2095 length:645 start_codon:yes stop_codon:yes gene_type:complete